MIVVNGKVVWFKDNRVSSHDELLKLLTSWFHEKLTACFVMGTHGSTREYEAIMYVREEDGRILISEYPDFVQHYIIPVNAWVLVEDGGRMIFADKLATLVLIKK